MNNVTKQPIYGLLRECLIETGIYDIVEIRQRLGRINRYANKFKYWEEKHNENRSN